MGTASAEEYVRLFRAKAEQMGEFPDKIIISALTGTATRHRDDMSPHIVALLESMICDPNHPAKHKLPLCYLVDSIVKNVTEPYAELFERGLVRWFCSAYDVGDETMKVSAKMKYLESYPSLRLEASLTPSTVVTQKSKTRNEVSLPFRHHRVFPTGSYQT